MDWTPARIKFELESLGFTYADLDRLYNLPKNTCCKASLVPIEAAEYAIAGILKKHPRQIWPSRYRSNGKRLKPQPKINYEQKRKKSNVINGRVA